MRHPRTTDARSPSRRLLGPHRNAVRVSSASSVFDKEKRVDGPQYHPPVGSPLFVYGSCSTETAAPSPSAHLGFASALQALRQPERVRLLPTVGRAEWYAGRGGRFSQASISGEAFDQRLLPRKGVAFGCRTTTVRTTERLARPTWLTSGDASGSELSCRLAQPVGTGRQKGRGTSPETPTLHVVGVRFCQ